MKNLSILTTLVISSFSFSLTFGQVGIGTPNPRGALDINMPVTNTSGLVLPTNSSPDSIVNPQGGDIAEGTIIYDSEKMCVRVYTGNSWSDCLSDARPTTSSPDIVADCSSDGFQGTFQTGTPLSGATFTITITNNSVTTVGSISFQTGDLVLNGESTSGISVSSVSPTSATINPGQSRTITYNLTGTPQMDGHFTGVWSKLNLSCSKSGDVGIGIRFAYWQTLSIGNTGLARFNSQLHDSINYGKAGTYTGDFTGFSFTNITSTLSALSAADLIEDYDIICTGYANMSVAFAAKIKTYVDSGGVAIILLDSNVGTNLFNAFGGTGSVGSGTISAVTNSNSINNGVFGDATNVTINAAGSYGRILTDQLPPNSVVLAEYNSEPRVFIAGDGGRAIFFWDEGVFRNAAVSGTVIDTPQEIFLHNIMAYALSKAGF